MSIPKLFITTIALAVATRAAPQLPYRPSSYCPVVDSSEEDIGTPWQIGVNVAGGSSISITETHTESITWTVGGDLNIAAGALFLGGSWSVAESVADGFGEGASMDCPEGKWRCSLVITPSVVRVKGHLKKQGPDDGCDSSPVSADDGGEDNNKFEYLIPIKHKLSNAKVTVDVCTCKDKKKWADPGHPELLCPEDCGSADTIDETFVRKGEGRRISRLYRA